MNSNDLFTTAYTWLCKSRLKEYPFLKKDAIKAALLYAAKAVLLEEMVKI